MIYPWKLQYWQSGEWQVCNERLKDLEKALVGYNPRRSDLFGPLRRLSAEDVRVCIIGQDPYPQAGYATGTAFSIPSSYEGADFPPTLRTIFDEYMSDLGYGIPSHGDLSRWEAQGVLLWNAIPTCRAGESLSHDWVEYEPLTREIIKRLSDKGIVFALLGAVARRFLESIDGSKNSVIITSHPSPRGNRNSKRPFTGSRLFTTINAKLNELGLPLIDWKLDDDEGSETKRAHSGLVRGDSLRRKVSRILQNTSGAPCCPIPDPGRLGSR